MANYTEPAQLAWELILEGRVHLQWRPVGHSRAEVLRQLDAGQRARAAARAAFSLQDVVQVAPRRGEPPVLVQPHEPIPAHPADSLWLWADGTLRAAPEIVIMDGPFDRIWFVLM